MRLLSSGSCLGPRLHHEKLEENFIFPEFEKAAAKNCLRSFAMIDLLMAITEKFESDLFYGSSAAHV